MRRLWAFVTDYIIPFIVGFIVIWGVWNFVGHPVTVSGDSMYPTLLDGEEYWVSVLDKDYQRGKVIIFQAPDNPSAEYVKRVIGVPGDTIRYQDDNLYVNGQKVDEPYLKPLKDVLPDGRLATPNFTLQTLASTKTEKVPEGKLFVMGDNRPISKDSEELGFIDEKAVKGVIKWQLLPIAEFGKFQPNGKGRSY